MTEFAPVNAPHLSYVVAWIEDGHVETTTSPVMCARMDTEPPELIPVVHTATPEGAPRKNLLHDSVAKLWFDLSTGERFTEWKAASASLWQLWDARQPAPVPAAPKASAQLEVPTIYEPQRPPHRQRSTSIGMPEGSQDDDFK